MVHCVSYTRQDIARDIAHRRKPAREAVLLVKRTFIDWYDDRAPHMAAALAYYTTFALAPILVIVIGVAGLVFGEDAVRGQLVRELSSLVGVHAAETISKAVASASDFGSSIWATIIGIVTLLVGATGVFVELQDALNIIWKVPPRPGTGWKLVLRERFLSFAMILGIGFLLLVSLVVSAGVTALNTFFEGWSLYGWALQGLNIGIGLLVTSGLFAMIFKLLPDTSVRWRDVVLGAVATAVLFTVGRVLIGLYLGQSSVSSAYGAAGSLAVLLVWVYYSAQIVFLGAEFTHAVAVRHGHANGIVAATGAVRT